MDERSTDPIRLAGDSGLSAELPENALVRLIGASSSGDDVSELVPVLWSFVQRPLAVLDARMLTMACAPAHDQAIAGIVAALAEGHRRPPHPWRVHTLTGGGEVLGHLLLRIDPPLGQRGESFVGVGRLLLAEQLRRAALAARVQRERREALKRRLITWPAPSAASLREEAQRVALPLADFYWPAVVSSERDLGGEPLLLAIEGLLRDGAPEHIALGLDDRTLLLLLGQDAAGTGSHCEAAALAGQAVRVARSHGSGACVRAVLANASVPLAEVPRQVIELQGLRPHLPLLATAADCRDVVPARAFALHRLLDRLDRRRLTEFVVAQIGPLIAYDRAHGTELADILEVTLDQPHRDDAAKAAYMHRNTLRRRVAQAEELLDGDLNDTNQRLAVHLALKLRKRTSLGAIY